MVFIIVLFSFVIVFCLLSEVQKFGFQEMPTRPYFKFTDGGKARVMQGSWSSRTQPHTHRHTRTHLGSTWINGKEDRKGVAIETGGQWCWILLLGRRGRHSESGVTCCGGGNNIRAESEGTLNISV